MASPDSSSRPAAPPTACRVLYLSHVGAFGGATKSLSELVSAFAPGTVDGTAITPRGKAAESLARSGLATILTRGIAQWDDTRFSHYRGLRWLIVLRELAYWPATLAAIRRARRLGPFDLIHCNEVTALLPALVAKRWLGVPLVVHVRSLQRGEAGGRVTRWLLARLRRGADAIIAIDGAVRRTLPADLDVDVIHNGLRAPAPSVHTRAADAVFTVSMIGLLHRAKGVYEFIEAARLLNERGVEVRMLVAGDNVRPLAGLRGWALRKFDFARDVRAELEALVAQHGLGEIVTFTGFVADLPLLYGRSDALCFPSHLDAPGRPVFEAALFGLPAIVAMRDPTEDVFIADRTAICIADPTPVAIADAIERLATNPALARAMGEQARQLALGRFESGVTAAKTLSLYRRLIARSAGAR